MKFPLFLIVSLFLMQFAYTIDDKECKNMWKNFIDYTNNKNYVKDKRKIEEWKLNVDVCFQNAGCITRNVSGKSSIGALVEKLNLTFERTPADVVPCLKEELKKLVAKKLNECLVKKHEATINIQDADDEIFNDMYNFKGREDENAEKRLQYVAAFAGTMKKCIQNKGDQAKDKIVLCNLDDPIKTELCKRHTECKILANTSSACEHRYQEIKLDACDCKGENLDEAKNKIEELQVKGRDVYMVEVMTVADVGQIVKDMDVVAIEKCFTDHGHQPSRIVTLLKNAQNSGTDEVDRLFGFFEPQVVTQTQLQQIHDYIADQLMKNKDCKMCN